MRVSLPDPALCPAPSLITDDHPKLSALPPSSGFREYLWSPPTGMAYAMGTLATAKFGRYIVTILFDMFFTVILFKQLFTRLVRFAGFTVRGREWIANGFCSATISVLTFKVYANMTRFEWAYPSGTEDRLNQWISGQTMVLATVIMSMVYLTSETRTRIGEPGINDPHVKLFVVGFTFFVLWLLQDAEIVDPSMPIKTRPNISAVSASTITESITSAARDGDINAALLARLSFGAQDAPPLADFRNVHLPLTSVCSTMAKAWTGFLIFNTIAIFSLGFVIFGTSAQSLTGLRMMLSCEAEGGHGGSAVSPLVREGPGPTDAASWEQGAGAANGHTAGCSGVDLPRCNSGRPRGESMLPPPNSVMVHNLRGPKTTRLRQTVRNPSPVDVESNQATVYVRDTWGDRFRGQFALFLIFLAVIYALVVFFTFVPLYSASGTRQVAEWHAVCWANDQVALARLGLS